MRTVIFAFTEAGKGMAKKIAACLPDPSEALLCVPERLCGGAFSAYTGKLPEYVGQVFDRDALIFVGAAGIAVRAIAPHVASKLTDPAVICVDEKGQFVIPLLSGHIGGANALADYLAGALRATPVLTTATDVNGRFSVDEWAARHGMAISSLELARRVSAEILVRDVPFYTDAPRPERLPKGLVWSDSGELGICVSVHNLQPFDNTLLLMPRALRVGIGCRKSASIASIREAVEEAFGKYNLRTEAVARAASIDVKVKEQGLIDYCGAMGWPIDFYSAGALNRVRGPVSGSEFVKRTVGTDNVCERAALCEGGRLIAPKTARCGVTVAVAETDWRMRFE